VGGAAGEAAEVCAGGGRGGGGAQEAAGGVSGVGCAQCVYKSAVGGVCNGIQSMIRMEHVKV
jgi:hypothetical protein